jgi:hypothetical protein
VRAEQRLVEERERAALGVAERAEAAHVLTRAADLVVAVLDEPVIDVGVRELLEQRRREADGDAIGDAVPAKVVEQAEERQVGPEDGLVHPLLAVRPAAGAAGVREMGMEDDRERLGHPPDCTAMRRSAA